ncbi:MAG TPA: type IX secretion system plug protein domain-containing protein [Bacteroidales bacterium]|nr:type IX secretion system plug protein domain-containing protein [Bacteroidales bacterium]
MIRIFVLSISFLIFPLFCLSGQDNSICDFASENVKSVWFEKEDWRITYPVLTLNSDEQLALHFDIIDGDYGSLSYRIIHCDRNWNNSDLFASDYLEGFEENRITSYEASFNTTVSYTHYILRLPNEDIHLKISGNYLVSIYPVGESENPLLTRRFYVHEGVTNTGVTFRRPMKPGKTESHQQPEITVSTGSLRINDPYRDVTLSILQNGRPDRAKMNLVPDFVGNGRIEYNSLSDKTLFPGDNEFRFFDIKTIRQKRQNVRAIEYFTGNYHVFLLPSEDREFKQYFSSEDFNGKYWIAMEESDTPDRDADYVYVYFTLPVSAEVKGGSVYVSGAFTDWSYGPLNRMTYNISKGSYEAVLLLKQGWYNYEYDFVPDRSGQPEGFYFEGSHYETENDYLILTYFRDPTQRYDRLTGATVVNTRGKKE